MTGTLEGVRKRQLAPDVPSCPTCFWFLGEKVTPTVRVGGRDYCDVHAGEMAVFLDLHARGEA